ncbi:phage Gp37/Gp68 family protein [Pararhodobacter sp.]|uniref:phage Gp37/Gp68 family protein n=1 Tax=Pararhodobacter sp. TaxID=2127056 RepID=UPI002FDCC286
MAENSTIEWTHHTFNPWEGCQKVGPGCDNCYAEARDIRFTGGTHWGPGAPRRRTSVANWRKPLAWDRAAALAGERHRVFCASLADVFDNAVDPAWRDDLWRLIEATPNLDWMLLTKRPGNIAKMLPPIWGAGWHNVWLGCTVVNQEEADRDIPKLLAVPAAIRFLSMEPLLGPVDLMSLDPHGDFRPYGANGWSAIWKDNRIGRAWLDLVIVGGESGKKARVWVGFEDACRSLRDQCAAAGTSFFMKQMAGPRKSTMPPIPDDLMVREMPNAQQ